MSNLDETTVVALVDELEKIGGLGSFLTRGIKGWGNIGRRSLGQHAGIIKNIAQKGYKKGGVWEAAKRLGKTRYAPMAATAGVGLLAAKGAKDTLSGDRRRPY